MSLRFIIRSFFFFFPFLFDIIITQVITTREDKVLYRSCLTVSIWCMCFCSGTPRQARCAAWRLRLQPPRRAGPEHLVGERVHDSSCNHRVKSLHLRRSPVTPFAVVITHSALLSSQVWVQQLWSGRAVRCADAWQSGDFLRALRRARAGNCRVWPHWDRCTLYGPLTIHSNQPLCSHNHKCSTSQKHELLPH